MDGKPIDVAKLNLFMYGKMDPDYVDSSSSDLWDIAKPKIDYGHNKGIGGLLLTSTIDEEGSMSLNENIWRGEYLPSAEDGYRFFIPAVYENQLDALEKLEIYEKEYLPLLVNHITEKHLAWELWIKKAIWMYPEALISFEDYLNCKDNKQKNMKEVKLKWQTRDEMENTTNPFQQLKETLCSTSRDCSKDKMIAFLYAIICGWDDESYKDLKVQHDWSDSVVLRLKDLHNKFEIGWNLMYDHLNTENLPSGDKVEKSIWDRFKELNEADGENGTHNLALSNAFVSGNKVKQGAHITMGAEFSSLVEIMEDKVRPILLLINWEEFEKTK
ncbi:hypothetical protein KO02_12335 [Sphingobacterium sp. ML3W]|uniref:hypothetical protein n=1 Tax=Sphingobacterium sp. ML3W TaxID=1538644 RepID=UPI0004F93093|nr:hypothetical protein [Sphingobacterium sp. ML3W]AIM37391.1 hypothetical protein KO02_12335 [Sphingobacterium sp. ML3W]